MSTDAAPPTVADGFASYWRSVVPAGAPDVQVQECRRAFYAGAWAMYCALVIHTADLSDADGERYLEALRRGLRRGTQRRRDRLRGG